MAFGDLYVADSRTDRVYQMQHGVLFAEFPFPAGVSSPAGLDVDAATGDLYFAGQTPPGLWRRRAGAWENLFLSLPGTVRGIALYRNNSSYLLYVTVGIGTVAPALSMVRRAGNGWLPIFSTPLRERHEPTGLTWENEQQRLVILDQASNNLLRSPRLPVDPRDMTQAWVDEIAAGQTNGLFIVLGSGKGPGDAGASLASNPLLPSLRGLVAGQEGSAVVWGRPPSGATPWDALYSLPSGATSLRGIAFDSHTMPNMAEPFSIPSGGAHVLAQGAAGRQPQADPQETAQRLVARLRIRFADGTVLEYASEEVAVMPTAWPRIITASIQETLPDPLTRRGGGILAQIQCSNLPQPQAGPTISALLVQGQQVLGANAEVHLTNPDTGNAILSVYGFVTQVDVRPSDVRLSISDDLLGDRHTRVPVRLLAPLAPGQDIPSDSPIPPVYGRFEKIPLYPLDDRGQLFGAWDVATTDNLGPSHIVYREGGVVPPAEYRIITVPELAGRPAYAVEFLAPQTRSDGTLPTFLLSQVPPFATRVEPSLVLRDLLTAAGVATDSASWDESRVVYRNLFLYADGAQAERRPLGDLVPELLWHGAHLRRTAQEDPEIRIVVDEPTEAIAEVELGAGDDVGLLNMEVQAQAPQRLESQIRQFTLYGALDPSLRGNDAWRVSARHTRALPHGTERDVYLRFAHKPETIDREAQFRWQAYLASEGALRATVPLQDPAASRMRVGEYVRLTIPVFGLTRALYRVAATQWGLAAVQVTLWPWDPGRFQYQPGQGTITVSPRLADRADFSRTLPQRPLDYFRGPSLTFGTGDDRIVQMSLFALTPRENVSHMLFRAVFQDGAATQAERTIPANPFTLVGTALNIPFGHTYAFEFAAVNERNHPQFRIGEVAQLMNVVV